MRYEISYGNEQGSVEWQDGEIEVSGFDDKRRTEILDILTEPHSMIALDGQAQDSGSELPTTIDTIEGFEYALSFLPAQGYLIDW